MISSHYNLITVLGPTASGKTKIATLLAYHLNGEIISGDSRQVYRGMNIGTGKDLNEYRVMEKPIPYHLIDITDPGTHYNVYEFQNDFVTAFNNIILRDNWPILCGGSGMYLEAVLNGYELLEVPPNNELRKKLELVSMDKLSDILKGYKKLHNSTDLDNRRRTIRAIEIEEYYLNSPKATREYPLIKPLIIGLDIDRELRRYNISKRLKQRLEEGMIDEIKQLLNEGVTPDDLIYYGLEYKYVTLYVIGEISYSEMFASLEIAIHQFAKRQMTWFRGMERRGLNIYWIKTSDSPSSIIKTIKQLIK